MLVLSNYLEGHLMKNEVQKNSCHKQETKKLPKQSGSEKHPPIPMKLQHSLDSTGVIYRGVDEKDAHK